ncbi:hypothetical protein [Nitrospira sp. M1]
MNQEHESESTSRFFGPEAPDLFLKLKKQLRDEGDRGTVIVGAALIDESLEQLLKARLVPSTRKKDELLDNRYAPIASLSAKIDLAYRVGIIRVAVHSTLHLFRKLRNDFAHSSKNLDFNSLEVQNRIRELFKLNSDLLNAIFKDVQDVLRNIDDEQIRAICTNASQEHSSIENLLQLLGWRGVFDLLTALICVALKQLPNQVEQIKSPEL